MEKFITVEDARRYLVREVEAADEDTLLTYFNWISGADRRNEPARLVESEHGESLIAFKGDTGDLGVVRRMADE